MSVFDEFEWRGMLHTFSENTKTLLATEKVTAYIGFDPSANSLHVGSLLPAIALARLQRFGHTPIAIVGGGTGLIGDPSGKTQERQLLTTEQVEENLRGIRRQLERFLDFGVGTNPAQIVNNADWLTSISLMDFLRDIGKHFSVNSMLAKESVKRRLRRPEEEGAEEQDGVSAEGISFTEFSYMLLQAYDFLVLYDRYNCKLQMGGSDQWGNIVAGAELIRRLRSERSQSAGPRAEKSPPLAYGIVFPLVTTAAGVKFGKTEAGAVWLDAERTSPFHFYQFWLTTDDRDVGQYLKFFTWLEAADIEELEASARDEPQRREAQKRLAQEVTRMVHGDSDLARAERASGILFGGAIAGIGATEIEDIFADVPCSDVESSRLQGGGLPLADLVMRSGLASSRGEARRDIQGGGIYVNNQRCADDSQSITTGDVMAGRFIVLRKGKQNYHLLRVR